MTRDVSSARTPRRTSSGDADDPSLPLFDGSLKVVEQIARLRDAFLGGELRIEARRHCRDGVEAPDVRGRRREPPGARRDIERVGERRLDFVGPAGLPLSVESGENVISVVSDPAERRDGTDDPPGRRTRAASRTATAGSGTKRATR